MVLLLHGFTGWKEEEHLSTLAEALSAQGIGTLRLDAPGSGESDGSFADDYRLTNYLDSIPAVVSFMTDQFGVSPKTTGIWGHSMGGFVATASACHHDKFAALCASQPSVGKSAITSDEESEWKSSGWASFPNENFKTLDLPFDFHLDRQQYDVFAMIEQLSIPALFISGTFDESVPASKVKSIFEAAPEHKTYLEFPTGHAYKWEEKNLEEINKVTVDFFVQHLRK